jgi:hypothetical protein
MRRGDAPVDEGNDEARATPDVASQDRSLGGTAFGAFARLPCARSTRAAPLVLFAGARAARRRSSVVAAAPGAFSQLRAGKTANFSRELPLSESL